MYARTIKITFQDKFSKEMLVNYSNNVADSIGIKSGLLLKFIIEQSETVYIWVLVFADHDSYEADHKNNVVPLIESLKIQGLRVDLSDGPVVGDVAVSSNFMKLLKDRGTFYER